MSNYFSYFPKIQQDLTDIGQTILVTNILRRFKVKSSVKDQLGVYYNYNVQAGERPDTIAERYYGDSAYAWVVLLYNDITDPIFGWALFNKDLEDYIKGKYGSIAAAQSTVHEYRRILNTKQTKVDGSIINERYVVVDKDTYDTLGGVDKVSVSKWDWELEQNEKKRRIKILHEKYLNTIVGEAEDILRNGV